MDLEVVHRRGDANLVSYLKHLASTVRGGSYDDSGGVLTFAGGHAYPGTYTNGVIRINDAASPAQVLARAEAFFGPLRRGYAVWIRGHADADLEAAAQAAEMFQRPPVEGNPAIAYTGAAIALPKLDDDVVLQRVDSAETRQQYLEVILEGYGVGQLPLNLAETVMFNLASIDDRRVAAFIASIDGVALSGCMAYTEAATAGLQWGATLPAARGRGLGKATFVAANNAAIDEFGADLIVGQASQMGVPLWVSLGFEVVTHYRRYLAKPPK